MNIKKTKHGYMDFSNLPLRKDGKIDWCNSCLVGSIVKFKYDNIHNELKILEFDKTTRKLKVLYNNNTKQIGVDNFSKGQLQIVLGMIVRDFRYELGQEIKTEKRHCIILDRKNFNGYKKYKVKCLNCGFECGEHYNPTEKAYKNECWVHERDLLKTGCLCCTKPSRIVVKEINSIYTTDKWMFDMLVNKEDGFTHTSSSGENLLFKCLECGKEKIDKPRNIYTYKAMACSNCSDGLSYGEKYMSNILYQLLGNDYIWQFTKPICTWCGDYRYDFYFEYNNEKYIIEINGGQHRKDVSVFKTDFKDQQINDINKKNLALENGIKEENYIVIDYESMAKEEDFILAITNSKLSEIFDLSIINWETCGLNASKSILIEVCKCWNENPNVTISDLILKFKLCRNTIRSYLKKGESIGLCCCETRRKNGRKVEVFDENMNSLGVFESASYLDKHGEELFGVRLISNLISLVCNGKRKSHKNLIFKFVL